MSSSLSPYRGKTESAADRLLEKLEEPKVVEALSALLDKTDQLVVFTDVLEFFLQRSEGMLESMSKSVGQLARAGTSGLATSLESFDLDDLKAASGKLQRMLPMIRDLITAFDALQKAGFFDAEVMGIVGRTGRAMASTVRDPKAHSTDTRGIFSLMGLLKDPDIARTINFMVSFARHFGGDLNGGTGAARSNTSGQSNH